MRGMTSTVGSNRGAIGERLNDCREPVGRVHLRIACGYTSPKRLLLSAQLVRSHRTAIMIRRYMGMRTRPFLIQLMSEEQWNAESLARKQYGTVLRRRSCHNHPFGSGWPFQ